MIKLVATDLDGTLLYPKKRIAGLCSSNRKFLRFLSDNSIEIVLVTGRNPKILKKINKIAHNDCKLFGCNGAYLVTKDGIKDKKPLNRDKLLLLFSELYGRYGIFGYFLFDDSQYTHIFLKNLSPTISNVFRLGNFFNGVLKEKLIIGEENFFKTIPYKDYYKFMISVGLGEEAKKRAIELAYAINEKYSDYVRRCSLNAVARAVKIHDLEDNMDISRLKQVTEKDLKRLNKYLVAYRFLLSVGEE